MRKQGELWRRHKAVRRDFPALCSRTPAIIRHPGREPPDSFLSRMRQSRRLPTECHRRAFFAPYRAFTVCAYELPWQSLSSKIRRNLGAVSLPLPGGGFLEMPDKEKSGAAGILKHTFFACVLLPDVLFLRPISDFSPLPLYFYPRAVSSPIYSFSPRLAPRFPTIRMALAFCSLCSSVS